MEQTVLRPKPMPGRAPAPGHRPHAARRRARRFRTVLGATVIALVLVLAGIGLGTVGATVIGMSKLADLQKQAAAQGAPPSAGMPGKPGQPGKSGAPGKEAGAPTQTQPQGGRGESVAPAPATIGVEAVDPASGKGARLVGVHQPGPGFSAGLVRGDVITSFAGKPVDSAQDLARAVAAARPGKEVPIGVRHDNGNRQVLAVIPGVVT